MRQTFVILLLLLAANSAHGASFSCKASLSPDEKVVCHDPLISSLDTRLGDAYLAAKQDDPETALQASRDFQADRKSCGSDRACILATYVAILVTLNGPDALPKEITAGSIAAGQRLPLTGLPSTLGKCVSTIVTEVHPRLEGSTPPKPEDFDSGTGIEFANDGYQVSYAREEALISSRPGDKVTMCLISIPHRCPPDDDRGRGYLTTNLRTGQSWAMGDSQHICGGQ